LAIVPLIIHLRPLVFKCCFGFLDTCRIM
jgi:hypothetical protein